MTDFTTGQWLNPPPSWRIEKGVLHLSSGLHTDFWQHTHYGFQRDSGHFLQFAAAQEFTALLVFEGAYQTLYDQAGLMLRLDEKHWIKCGIEHSDGTTNFSVVVTKEHSDWSVIPVPLVSGPQTIQLTLKNNAAIVHFLTPDGRFALMRVTSFPHAPNLSIGPMACSPERSGFEACFLDFRLMPPLNSPLHL